MTFGEKIKQQRKLLGLSQDDLSAILHVSRRTITSWETDTSRPRTRSAYESLADALDVRTSYLINEEEAFVLDAGEEFGARGRREASKLVSELTGLFAGGEMAEEDMDALMLAIQEAYVDAKRSNKKYGRNS